MKINELVTKWEDQLRQTEWAYPQQVIEWLENHGFVQLGRGFWSIAYHLPGANTIVKVSVREDKCYIKYAEWATKQHKQNPHLPQIYWINRFSGYDNYNTAKYQKNRHEAPAFPRRPNTFYISMIEKLDKMSADGIDRTPDITALAYMLQYPGMEFDTELMRDRIKDRLRAVPKEKQAELLQKAKSGAFSRTVNFIRKHFSYCGWDLKDDNVMYRKSSGHFIITDPIFGSPMSQDYAK